MRLFLKKLALLTSICLLVGCGTGTGTAKSGDGTASGAERAEAGLKHHASSSFLSDSRAASGKQAESSRTPAESAPQPAAGTPQNQPARKVRVLLYHDIMTPQQKGAVKNGLVITTDAFDRQMAILKQAGYESIGFDELYDCIQGQKQFANRVLITFDDGYRTCGYLAAPILRKYGYRAAVFVITKYLDAPPEAVNTTAFYPFQYLHGDELNRFTDTLDFASHTDAMHDDFDGKPMLLTKSPAEIAKDLSLSRSKLGGTTAFAYPFGKYNTQTIEILRKVGFRMAFTTHRGTVAAGIDPFEIPRYAVYAATTEREFKNMMSIA